MIRLCVALIDGSIVDEEFPNHEIESIEMMVQQSEDDLILRVDIEDSNGKIIYQYKRKITYAY